MMCPWPDVRSWLALLCLALVWITPAAAQTWTEQPQKNLGDGLYLKIRMANQPGPVFFIPHDNENVAVEAVERLGRGMLVELKQQHEGHPGKQIRYIAQRVTGLVFADPNRIYTSEPVVRRNFAPRRLSVCGVRMRSRTDKVTVTRFLNLGKTIAAELEKLVAAADRPLLVAVHNNTSAHGPDSLSVEFNEFKSRPYRVCKSGDVRCSSQSSGSTAEKRNPNNFFLVTDPEDFDLLKKQGWHAILQEPGRERDDGSLSYWVTLGGRDRRLRYINVEAEHGRRNDGDCPPSRESQWETQVRMLRAILEPSSR